MATIFSDGFEDGTHDAWEESASYHAIEAVGSTGLTGSYCINFNPWGYIRKAISSIGEVWISAQILMLSASGDQDIFSFYDSNGTKIASVIGQPGNHVIKAYVGASLVGTGSYVLTQNVVAVIEVHYKPLNSGGILQVRVDGGPSLDIDYSGDTTAGLEEIFKLQLGGSTNYCEVKADEFYADDAEWPGGSGPPPGGTVPGLFFANG